ncbi:MAG: hypothetical protein LBQ12_11600, partial [Deltaproteobacteria bacterium]|nr:hypothetical protein [Deltaproteobacteria bacterium]
LDAADKVIDDCLEEAFYRARVFQGGGHEMEGYNLKEMLKDALVSSFKRLYDLFPPSDHSDWWKVYEAVRHGNAKPLVCVGHNGETQANNAVKIMMEYLTATMSGRDIRRHFQDPPYGWTEDCIDGVILVLMADDLVTATLDGGRELPPAALDHRNMGAAKFRRESLPVTAQDRLGIAEAYKRVGLTAKDKNEASLAPLFIERALELARKAGGEAPKPAAPSTLLIEEIRTKGGNEQLKAIAAHESELVERIGEWRDTGERIDNRWSAWIQLKELADAADGLEAASEAVAQTRAVERNRQLLQHQDPVPGHTTAIFLALKEELSELDGRYASEFEQGLKALREDSDWRKLDSGRQEGILATYLLRGSDRPVVKLETVEELLETLRAYPLAHFRATVDAVSERFARAKKEAMALGAPGTKRVSLPSRTLTTTAEIGAWLDDARATLESALLDGPVKVG